MNPDHDPYFSSPDEFDIAYEDRVCSDPDFDPDGDSDFDPDFYEDPYWGED
jgi:hypothetical protein